MDFAGGMMEYEFNEESGAFQPTARLIHFILGAIANDQIKTAVNFYSSSQVCFGDELIEELSHRSLEMKQGLARMFEAARDFERASRVHEMNGDFEAAAAMAEQGFAFARAAQFYQRAGRPDKAAELLERDGQRLKAAELYLGARRASDAVRVLQQVPATDPARLSAWLMLRELYTRLDRPDQAAKVAVAIASHFPCNENTVAVYYDLALAYEQHGRPDHAALLLRKVVDYDPNFRDAATRLAGSAARTTPSTPRPPKAATDAEPGQSAPVVEGELRRGFEHVLSFPLFSKLSLADVQAFYDLSETVSPAVGEPLIREGEIQPHMYIVLEGEVEVFKAAAGGAVRLARLGSGSAVGELGVLGGVRATATVVAAASLKALRIHREALMDFLSKDPRRMAMMFESVVRELGRRLNDANERFVSSKTETP